MTTKNNADVYLTAFVAGVAAGVLGSRLLPPLLSQVNSTRRAKRGKDAFEQLEEDHRQIVACLRSMEDLGPESQVRRTMAFLKLKRTLARHAMAEEDVVYPLLVRQQDSSKHLYEEHADMKIALYHLEELIQQGGDWRSDVRSLRELIESHIHEEETVAFPMLRQRLNEEGLPKVSGQISREEALIL